MELDESRGTKRIKKEGFLREFDVIINIIYN